jgi:hypothetical protein
MAATTSTEQQLMALLRPVCVKHRNGVFVPLEEYCMDLRVYVGFQSIFNLQLVQIYSQHIEDMLQNKNFVKDVHYRFETLANDMMGRVIIGIHVLVWFARPVGAPHLTVRGMLDLVQKAKQELGPNWDSDLSSAVPQPRPRVPTPPPRPRAPSPPPQAKVSPLPQPLPPPLKPNTPPLAAAPVPQRLCKTPSPERAKLQRWNEERELRHKELELEHETKRRKIAASQKIAEAEYKIAEVFLRLFAERSDGCDAIDHVARFLVHRSVSSSPEPVTPPGSPPSNPPPSNPDVITLSPERSDPAEPPLPPARPAKGRGHAGSGRLAGLRKPEVMISEAEIKVITQRISRFVNDRAWLLKEPLNPRFYVRWCTWLETFIEWQRQQPVFAHEIKVPGAEIVRTCLQQLGLRMGDLLENLPWPCEGKKKAKDFFVYGVRLVPK